MTTPLSKQLSIGAGLAFAAWVVWLWVDPLKPDVIKKPVVQKMPQIVQKTQLLEPAPPRVYVLPAPPSPIQAPKMEVHKPAIKKIVETPSPKPKTKPFVKNKQVPKPESKPKKVETTKPKLKPVPKQEPKVHEATKTEEVGGRALLRVLEHGKGPQIEIAWPQNARVRDGLYEKFQSCFGMKSALMDVEGNLYRQDEARGVRWEINLDRFSGFLRQASGRLPGDEARLMDRISSRHGHLNDPVPVRVFPRRVDASLLGGLKSVIGEGYMNARSIKARYDENGIVEDIHIDGRFISGRVKLSQFKRCSWRV